MPEGVYRIEYLNPNSSYHLSMKVDYPNAYDPAMAKRDGRTRLGGDIFIHGKDVSIGCVALGDRAIEELFTLVAETGTERVKVIIAPNDLRVARRDHPPERAARGSAQLYAVVAAALADVPGVDGVGRRASTSAECRRFPRSVSQHARACSTASITSRKVYGPHDVLKGVTWQHNPGEHVGLVGRNGAGKTTLFRLLLKQEEPDHGQIIRASGMTIGHVGQHLDAEPGMSLFDFVETAFAEVLRDRAEDARDRARPRRHVEERGRAREAARKVRGAAARLRARRRLHAARARSSAC